MTSSGEPRAVRDAAGSGWTWSLLLPPGWVSLPVERAAGRAAVKALLDRRLGGLPRDTVAPVRIQLDRELRGLLAQAEEAGASSAHVHLDLVRGLPVSASLTVALLDVELDGDGLEEALRTVLGDSGDVVEAGSGSLADLPALRRRRRTRQPLSPSSGGQAVWSTAVDWVVPLPDEDGLVVLSFATVTDPVADELVALFDAIASSLELTPR